MHEYLSQYMVQSQDTDVERDGLPLWIGRRTSLLFFLSSAIAL